MRRVTVEFCSDAVTFLAEAEGFLTEHAAVASVIATRARDLAADETIIRAWPEGVPRWFAAAEDPESGIVGVAMRAATFDPYPIFVSPMPDAAADALAAGLTARGESAQGVNGSRSAGARLAAGLAEQSSGVVRVQMVTRLFAMATLVPPAPTVGELRRATVEDFEVVAAWFAAFSAEADRQAGRPPAETDLPRVRGAEILSRIRAGLVRLWMVDGSPVSMTGFRPPAYGVARVGPVFTPTGHRGNGYASATVAEVSAELLAAGAVPTLYTDSANPVSNRIYQRLGYRLIEEQANHVIDNNHASDNMASS